MLAKWNSFERHIEDIRRVNEIYDHLVTQANPLSADLCDLLRIQLVNAVSAFDWLMHEYIHAGIMKQLIGDVPMTPKVKGFSIDAHTYSQLATLDAIEKYKILSGRVSSVLRTMSFQSPEKIKEGLSHIWEKPHKWQLLSQECGLSEEDLTDKVKLYVERRNQIVHEADVDFSSGDRRVLEAGVVKDGIDLFFNLAYAISKLALGLQI
mgnify:FL=1